MIEESFIENNSSKLGFLFISFIVIASGFVTQVLSCQTQHFLQNSTSGKHLIGILICFLFIMLEGGWSFDMEEQNKSEVDWSNGNAIDSLIFGVILYTIFLLSSKMQLMSNIIFFILLFSIYLINAQRLYWKNRDLITNKQNILLIKITKINVFLAIIVFLYGFIDYYKYQKNNYGNRFTIFNFLFSGKKCSKIK